MTTGPFSLTAACLPPLSGSEDTDHHIPERLLQVHCVTNRSRQPPTHKLENDNPRDVYCCRRNPVKAEQFLFFCTSEGVLIASTLRVGDCAAVDMSCSCQSAGQTMYLCDLRPKALDFCCPLLDWWHSLDINASTVACKSRSTEILTKSTLGPLKILSVHV